MDLEEWFADEEDDPTADRDTWCTPRQLAIAAGPHDLDPCSNERSHIVAARSFRLDRGQDGLVLARMVPAHWRVWCNPPYSRGQVIRWVLAYRRTMFTFLLRLDPRTRWFESLALATQVFAIPSHCNFEPPPGVTAYSNIYPHALFYRRAADVPQAIASSCMCLERTHTLAHTIKEIARAR
jgi:hypothetical protein